ncbi:MAG: hypothetical protein NT015_14315 [Alphaproteobacteria bacterium]|nr:hypothetical protein [Alphaproteobacteria bacterium]
MSALSFNIVPSPDSNDHQVRILVDGADLLGDEYLGLDPVDFFAQFNAPKDTLLVGRCICGVIGCGDYLLDVRRSDTVEWIARDVVARFNAEDYDRVLSAASNDHSWETQGRRIERLINAEHAGAITTDGYDFDWASTRFKPGVLTLHFVKNIGLPTYAYRLVDLSWDGCTDESALRAARRYCAEQCD